MPVSWFRRYCKCICCRRKCLCVSSVKPAARPLNHQSHTNTAVHFHSSFHSAVLNEHLTLNLLQNTFIIFIYPNVKTQRLWSWKIQMCLTASDERLYSIWPVDWPTDVQLWHLIPIVATQAWAHDTKYKYRPVYAAQKITESQMSTVMVRRT